MKRILASALALFLLLTLAACGDEGEKTSGSGAGGGSKKAPQFSGSYSYAPPESNYYIKWQDYDAQGNKDGGYEVYACTSDGYTYAEEDAGVYHACNTQRKHYERAFDSGSWMVSPDYSYENYLEDLADENNNAVGWGDAFVSYFMTYFHAYGFADEKLAEYYEGNETVGKVNCWVFNAGGLNAIYAKFWVDPSNGMCLKYLDTESGEYTEAVVYDLSYSNWTENLAPADYSIIAE